MAIPCYLRVEPGINEGVDTDTGLGQHRGCRLEDQPGEGGDLVASGIGDAHHSIGQPDDQE